MKNSKILLGHLASFTAYLIFGFNIIACKHIANAGLLSPLGLFCARSLGATIVFWTISFFMPNEKVAKKDLVKLFFASMFGLFFTQMLFLVAITITTPLDTSILTSTTPIFTMFIAAIFLKEPITWKKAGGVAVSFCGVMMLIMNSVHAGGVAETKTLGIILIILNCLCFAFYLGAFKPLIVKYKTITFLKWMFLFSSLASLPFGFHEYLTLDYAAMPTWFLLDVGYVVVFATIIAYYLIPIGQKILRPTLISLYSYVQPMVAATISISLGTDTLGWQKVVAALLVFSGVAIVNKSKAASS